MKSPVKIIIAATALSITLMSSAFAAASIDQLQKTVTSVEGSGNVKVFEFVDGVVTLSGSVAEGIDISTIEDALLEMDGVKKFVNEIIVNK